MISSVALRLFSLGALALILSSCGQSLECVSKSETDQSDPFDGVQVDVGIDGSGSMTGFVARPGSRYIQAIDSLHTLLQSKTIPAKYWRIGQGSQSNSAQSLSASQFLDGRSPKFYSCQAQNKDYPCVSSTLEQIYSVPVAPKQETLKLLLTDLEPDAAAVGQLSGKISAELQAHPGYKAILLGVRSQYDGAIFSASTGNAVTRYSTDGTDVDTEGRPFYLLISGPSAAVDAVVNQFRQLPLKVNQAFRVSSFSLDGVDTVTLDSSKIPTKINACVDQLGALNRVRPARNQTEQWLLLEQSCSGQNEPLVLDVPSQESVALLGANLTPDVFNVSNPMISLKNVAVDNGKLTLSLGFDAQKISPRSAEEILITLDQRELDKVVWKGWDTNVAEPDGHKTQNLALFVGGLRGAVSQAQPENAIKYCLGFSRAD